MSSKMSDQYISVQIIDDSDDELDTTVKEVKTREVKENEIDTTEIPIKKKRVYRKKQEINFEEEKEKETKEIEKVVPVCLLKKFYCDQGTIEIGADEVGRGPMLGRVYSGAVVLPKDDSFDHFKMKDSKKFTSKNPKKINEVAEYIKANALAWAVEYEDETVIDEINILQATQSAMHKAIKKVIKQLQDKACDKTDYNLDTIDPNLDNVLLLIDGNYFKQLTILNKNKTKLVTVKNETVEGGDNKYTAIAAASIIAKVERDKYIEELCLENPELVERYGIDSNKGYGSKKHMDGIKQYGITKWHRRTFGLCKDYA
jgi:ribonuclease HII